MSEETVTNTEVAETNTPELTEMEQAIQAMEESDAQPEENVETETENVETETENVETETENVEDKTQDEKQEPLSKAWVKLNKRERDLQKQSEQLKQQIQWVQNNAPVVKQANDLINLAKSNPRDFLNQAGVSIEDFTNGLLEDPPPTKEVKELNEIKNELNSIKQERQQQQQLAQQQAKQQQLLNNYYMEQQGYIAKNIDMYPNIKEQNAHSVVWETTVHAARQGEVLSHEQACAMVNDYLETNQITTSGTVVKKTKEVPETKAPEAKIKTISNNLESQPASKSDNLTDEERMAEAIKALS